MLAVLFFFLMFGQRQPTDVKNTNAPIHHKDDLDEEGDEDSDNDDSSDVYWALREQVKSQPSALSVLI